MSTATLLIGDVFDRLRELPDDSVDLIVTSPPFLALRSYLPADHPDKSKEIGSEPTPAAFLDTLLALTAEWRRVLAPHGSLCVELGDTYSGSGGAGGDYNVDGWREGQNKFDGSNVRKAWVVDHDSGRRNPSPGWPPAKSLTGIPTLYTWSLAYGRNLLTGEPSPAGQWRIRNLLVWARPNPPVGALGDKFRPACSYITVACTGARRWFDLDAVRQPGSENTHARLAQGVDSRPSNGKKAENPNNNFGTMNEVETAGAPPLDWHSDVDDGPNGDRLWWMNTAPYKGAHYATFPLELPRRLIKAMCPQRVCRVCGKASERIVETTNSVGHAVGRTAWTRDSATTALMHSGPITVNVNHHSVPDRAERVTLGWSDCGHNNYRNGHVLDPFAGSGTTLAAAVASGRDVTGIDLDARNATFVDRRIRELVHVTDHTVTGIEHRWECVAPLPEQRDQIPGQTNLLDLLDGPVDMVDVDTGDLL